MTDTTSDWRATLDGLLHGRGQHTPIHEESLPGAQLVVLDAAANEVFRAALARHWRTDHQDANLIWIRPIVGGTLDPTIGLPRFDTTLTRRRALHVTAVVLDNDHCLTLALVSGEIAQILPASGEELVRLQRWDSWLAMQTAPRQTELAALATDT